MGRVEMGVHDQQRALGGAILRELGEAVLALGALRTPEALLRGDRKTSPRTAVDLEGQLVAVARRRLVGPFQDSSHLVRDSLGDFAAVVKAQLGVAANGVDPIETEIVTPALQHCDAHARRVGTHGRGVFLGELILKIFRGRRDNDAMPRHGGGHQVSERFTDPGASLDNGVAASREGFSNAADHLSLPLSNFTTPG
jgi:hypothetical protein